MALEQHSAGFLKGYQLYLNEQTPTLGLLRLDTDKDPLFLTVTRQSLRMLADACRECAEQLTEAQ
jgi:hypothetical protein